VPTPKTDILPPVQAQLFTGTFDWYLSFFRTGTSYWYLFRIASCRRRRPLLGASADDGEAPTLKARIMKPPQHAPRRAAC